MASAAQSGRRRPTFGNSSAIFAPTSWRADAGADHHLELSDHAAVVEGEFVDPLYLLPSDHGREFEHRDALVWILELVYVAKLTAESEHPFRRSQDLHDPITALVPLEQDRASEHRVLAEQACGCVDAPAFNGGEKSTGQQRRPSL